MTCGPRTFTPAYDPTTEPSVAPDSAPVQFRQGRRVWRRALGGERNPDRGNRDSVQASIGFLDSTGLVVVMRDSYGHSLRRSISFALAVALHLCASPAWSQISKPEAQQSAGMINGTIVDDTGAAIAGAKVTLSHEGI